MGGVILTSTTSSHNHCLIFWILECNQKNYKNIIKFYCEYIMYISLKFGINLMSKKIKINTFKDL